MNRGFGPILYAHLAYRGRWRYGIWGGKNLHAHHRKEGGSSSLLRSDYKGLGSMRYDIGHLSDRVVSGAM